MKVTPLRMAATTAVLALTLAGCAADDTAQSTSDPTAAPTTGDSTTPTAATTDPATEASSEPPPASPSPSATVAYPVTVTDSSGSDVTLEAAPEAIVSLSPTATESLFAIGAGDQVAAVDQFSYFPEEAPVTDLDAYNPNVEAITTYDPDLVIAQDAGLADQLAELDIPLLVQTAAADFDDVYAQIDQLGTVTGQADGATVLVEQMQGDIDKLVADAPDASGQTYFHELDSTLYSVTGDTFIGEVYGLFGLDNIADAVEDDAGGYPQLSPEFVIEADPDWVFLADASFGESAETVASRPGWDTLTAVTDDQVVALPEDVPSRWGPRVVDFVQVIADALAGRPADEGGATTDATPTSGATDGTEG